MIQVINKALLCSFCLFLLTVGCTNINSSNAKDTSNTQTSAPQGVTTSNTDRKNKLSDRIDLAAYLLRREVKIAEKEGKLISDSKHT